MSTPATQPNHAVSSVCNAIMDIVIQVTEEEFSRFGLERGIMHLVDQHRQVEILSSLSSHEHTVELGGSAMNAMRTLAQLGKKTVFAGMVSDDEFGRKILDRISSLDITSRISVGDGGTGTCVILVTPDGERTMCTFLGASRLYGGDIVPHEDIKDSQVFHFCGYQWDTEGQKSGIKTAIDTAKNAGTKVSFDIADPFVVGHNKEDFSHIIQNYADIVFANEEEAKILFGKSPLETAKQIASNGATAVVKLGAKGAIICRDGVITEIPAAPASVVDTTAAGDMFAAGFLYGYTSGKTLEQCGQIAAYLASDVISRYGARVSDSAISAALKI